MEPGHEDREYANQAVTLASIAEPQWSPVMKTGNTSMSRTSEVSRLLPQWSPVMKTGNTRLRHGGDDDRDASMEPGHEDREYGRRPSTAGFAPACLNEAYS